MCSACSNHTIHIKKWNPESNNFRPGRRFQSDDEQHADQVFLCFVDGQWIEWKTFSNVCVFAGPGALTARRAVVAQVSRHSATRTPAQDSTPHSLERISNMIFPTHGERVITPSDESTRSFQSHHFVCVCSPYYGQNRLGKSSPVSFWPF